MTPIPICDQGAVTINCDTQAQGAWMPDRVGNDKCFFKTYVEGNDKVLPVIPAPEPESRINLGVKIYYDPNSQVRSSKWMTHNASNSDVQKSSAIATIAMRTNH